MYTLGLIDRLPLMAIFLLLAILIVCMIEIGFRIGHRPQSQSAKVTIGPMSAGLASLLAFILAIAFNMAAERNNARKQYVVTETNAIGTLYYRTDLLSPKAKLESKQLLKRYVDLRIIDDFSPQSINGILEESEQIQAQLWKIMLKEVEQPGILHLLYIEALNEVIDMHTLRVNRVLDGRIPASIWGALLLLTCLAMVLSGMQLGSSSSSRNLLTVVPFSLAFALIFTLIVELDRPVRSVINISDAPIVALFDDINADLAAQGFVSEP